MKCYKVEVRTTNVIGNTVETPNGFLDCKHGVLHVVTDTPEQIYNWIGKDKIKSITDIGFGYSLIPLTAGTK